MSDIPVAAKRALQQWTDLIDQSVAVQTSRIDHELRDLIRGGIFKALRAIYLLLHGKTRRHQELGAYSIMYWLLMTPSGLKEADVTETELKWEVEMLESSQPLPLLTTQELQDEINRFVHESLWVFAESPRSVGE